MNVHDADMLADIASEIASGLCVRSIELRPLRGGTNDRTFFAQHGDKLWVVRIEPDDGVQLRRAVDAQTLARRAGVVTPEIVATHLSSGDMEAYQWVVEKCVAGVHFEPMRCERAERNALRFHLGQQLRMLHSVVVDGFGLMPPDPWDMTVPTMVAWAEREIGRVPWALQRAGMRPDVLPQIADVYAMVRDGFAARPRLCHGDCASTNILVDRGRVTALIDWEWARGGDPAANIAYWAFWQDDLESLDALLAGYDADHAAAFRARVLAYRVITALDLVRVYDEHGGPDDIQFCRAKLEDALSTRPWLRT